MKKNMAIAMSAMMTAGTVVPAFAAENTAEVTPKIVDVRTARGEKLTIGEDGFIDIEALKDTDADFAQIETAKKALEDATTALEKKSSEKYISANDEVKYKYTVQVNEEESTLKKDILAVNDKNIIQDTFVVYDVIDNQTKKVVEKYVFKGLKKFDLDHNFGQGEAGSEYKDEVFNFATATKDDYAKLAKIKAELIQNASKIKLEQEKISKEENTTSYDIELTVMLTDGIKIATITFENVEKYDKAIMAKEDGLLAANTNGDIKSHWAKNEVLAAMDADWVDATATFRPEDQITRAEFVKVINRAFGIKSPKSLVAQFSDVDTNAWYAKEVNAAVVAGYINGYEDGTFRPDQPITRQEAAKIIATVMNNGVSVETLKSVNETTSEHVDVETAFIDDASIAAWADESVVKLSDEKIIKGYEEKIGGVTVYSFGPANNITRAEAIVMMQRAAK